MLGRSRTPLAWLILTEHRARFILALGRIAFAVVLMFSQLGFLTGFLDSQAHLIRFLNADIFMVSRVRYFLDPSERFSRRRLYQARAVPGVVAAYPLYVQGRVAWRDPANGQENPLRLLGFNPRDPVFTLPEIDAGRAAIRPVDTALFDRNSRNLLGSAPPGTITEVNGRKVRIVGGFDLSADFATDGHAITSDNNFFRYVPHSDPGEVDIGLLRVAPGTDPAAVAEALRQELPDDVEIFTRDAFIARERSYWRKGTAAGSVFTLGLVVGFLVGVLTCYQILFRDVTTNLPRFAVLKAIGYPNSFLVGVVLREAVLLAVTGFVPGVLGSVLLYRVLRGMSGVQMQLTVGRVTLVAVLTVVMCLAAAVIAVRKALKADPAELLR